MHQFTETRRKGDGRKMVHCMICHQEWTAVPRIHCPGVPVVAWNGKEPGNLRTRTQARKEHYLLPDEAQPVAALRLGDDPWYVWLYDISQCEQWLPTEKQRESLVRREYTLRERYGCRLCTKRYLKKEARYHVNGVCQHCRHLASSWNVLLQWARGLMEDPPPILALVTEPTSRAMAVTRPDEHYQITGYQSIDLATGELVAERSLAQKEDYAVLYGLLQMSAMANTRKPLFLLTSSGDYRLFWDTLRKLADRREVSSWPWETLTTCLPIHQQVPGREKDWAYFPAETLVQRVYYTELCKILGVEVEPEASVPSMLRQVIGHLASREMIEL